MIRFTVPVPVLGPYSVDIDCYQWGYVEGTIYVVRELGFTPAGARQREVAVGIAARTLEVRFAQHDLIIDRLHWITVYALRLAHPVQFFPDTADLGTFRLIDWAETVEITRITEKRRETTLRLTEQPA